MNFRRLIGILIPAFFAIYFICEIFVREHWSFKVPAILIALVTAAVLVQNIADIKYSDEKRMTGKYLLAKQLDC